MMRGLHHSAYHCRDSKETRNYYPTQSCIRYHSQANEYTVSMEGFTLREASAAEAIRVER